MNFIVNNIKYNIKELAPSGEDYIVPLIDMSVENAYDNFQYVTNFIIDDNEYINYRFVSANISPFDGHSGTLITFKKKPVDIEEENAQALADMWETICKLELGLK